MWRSPDGDVLWLPAARADMLRGRLARLGLTELVKAHHRGDLGVALQNAAASLVRRARRRGTLCSPVTQRCHRIYVAWLGGRSYRLLTRDAGGDVQRIELIDAGQPVESQRRIYYGLDDWDVVWSHRAARRGRARALPTKRRTPPVRVARGLVRAPARRARSRSRSREL